VPRPIAGSQRISFARNEQKEKPQTQPPFQTVADLYTLPISTEELGHLPVYESFDWGVPFESGLGAAPIPFDFDYGTMGACLIIIF
jgi:hypothetical protein